MCRGPIIPVAPAPRLTAPPDMINETVYSYGIQTDTTVYNEDHEKIGVVGPYSFRPNGNPGIDGNGAIELITEQGSKRLYGIVKYEWNNGVVVLIHRIE